METAPMAPSIQVWIDLEMTGLDPREDQIIEVAAIATYGTKELDRFSAVLHLSQETFANIPDNVRAMHSSSGLIDECLASNYQEVEADVDFANWITLIVSGKNAVHCGYFLETDRIFLRERMPHALEALGHRQLDLRSLEELYEAFLGGRLADHGRGRHRAMSDVEACIALATTYATAAEGRGIDITRE